MDLLSESVDAAAQNIALGPVHDFSKARRQDVILFYRQFQQLCTDLKYPERKSLRSMEVQSFLFRSLFDVQNLKPVSPLSYRRRVLKKLLLLIEDAFEDPDEDEISDDLMQTMSDLSTAKDTSPSRDAQTKSLVTYFIELAACSDESPRIVIFERPNLLAGQGTTGFRTWGAALHLGTYLVTGGRHLVENRRILELGAGTGFLSILCATIGAKTIFATDGDPAIVSQIQANVELNKRNQSFSSQIYAGLLRWGTDSAFEHELIPDHEELAYDLIVGADVTYDLDALDPLASTLEACAQRCPEATTIIGATARNTSTIAAFKDACGRRNLDTRELAVQCPSPSQQEAMFHSHDPPIFLLAVSPRKQSLYHSQTVSNEPIRN